MRRFAGGNGRQILSIGVVMAALGSGLVMAGMGQVSPPLDSRHLTDSTVWVPTASLGLVHPIDATVGRSGPALALDGAQGDDLTTVQAGSNGYVINQTDGTVRFIDASARQFGLPWQEDGSGADGAGGEGAGSDGAGADGAGRLSVFPGSGVTWAYSTGSHLLHRLNPGTRLLEVTQPIPLVADGDDAVLRHDTDLVAPDESEGEVLSVSPDGQVRSAPVAPAGHDLVVRMVDDTVVAVDRDDRMLITLGPDLRPVNRCKLDVTDAPVPVEGDSTGGRLALVVPSQHIVVVAEVTTCRVVAVRLDGDLGVPVVVGTRVFVPEYGQGRVHIADLSDPSSEQIPVVQSEPLGVTGRFDLVADDGMVVFNDPGSNAAGAVFPDGTVARPGKFDLGDTGRPIGGGSSDEPGPGVGSTEQKGGGGAGSGEGNQESPTGKTPNDGSPDPASPTKSPTDPNPATDPTPDPPDPADPTVPQLQCAADRPSVPVGQSVTFTTQVIGGQTGAVTSFEFAVGPEVVPDADGVLARPFPASGQVTVTVRGILSGGGTTAVAGCGTIAVGDAPLPDALVCRSDTGQAAQVDQLITFSASGITASTWEWTFSDGQTSREVSPQHRFSQPGPASATIATTSASAGRVTATCPLQISEGVPPLTPGFDYQPKPAVAGQPVRFVSTTPNPTAIASYSWSFAGGQPATATGAEVTAVTWAAAGSRSVELVVTNTAGQTYRVSSTVDVQPAPATYVPPAVAVNAIGDTITTSTIALGFVTTAGQPTSAQWTVSLVNDSGVPRTVASPTGLTASYTIPEHDGGVYTVTVVATDSRGGSATDSVSFNAVRPLNPSIGIGKTPVVVNEAVTFTGTSTNPNVTSWSWDFGDGQTGQGQTVNHTYTSPGDKRVTLTVGLKGASTSVVRTVTVNGAGSVATVPKVTGLSLSAAGSSLTGAGLTVGTTTRGCQPGIPLDQVYGQDPPENTQVAKPSAVNLSVSDGTSWAMPDIAVGQTPADLGLSGKLTITPGDQVTNDPAQDGKKASQSVAAGTSQCGQVNVTLVVYKYVAGPPPTLSCDADVTYPASGTCTAENNPSGGTVDWGDGSGPEPIGPGATLSHAYRRVGAVTPRLTHNGATVNANTVSIKPDISVTCAGTGSAQDVYKLDASGAYVRPVDPATGLPDPTKRIVEDTAVETGSCSVTSKALADLGGSVSWTATSRSFSASGSGDYTARQIGNWLGVQPGSISMTVTVNTVSQMANAKIYVSGCG